MGSQLWIWIQLQNSICVVTFLPKLRVHTISSSSTICVSLLVMWGDQLQIQIHICIVPFEGALQLRLWSHLCLTLDYVGGNSSSNSSPISIQPELIGGSTPEKSGVNCTFCVYRNLSAAHDWIGSSSWYGQWAKKHILVVPDMYVQSRSNKFN